MEINELLLEAHRSNQNTSICALNYSTGNTEQVYKNGGTALPNSLHLLANSYLITANQDKPLLHIWPLNSQEKLKNINYVMPEVISCIAVNNTNNYVVAGIGLKLYVWQLNTGKLLNILRKHYQTISCVKFSCDSAYVVATGIDGMLVVYKINDIVSSANSFASQKTVGECEPLYTKMDCSMITHFAIGSFKSKSKIATTSSDRTCHIYTLDTGEQLLTLVFRQTLTSVIFDSTSWNIYIGDAEGVISRISLHNPARTLEHHVELSRANTFIGHKKQITCLDINYANEILASGAEDCNIIIWDIMYRNALRTIECTGSITNLKFVLKCGNFGVQTLKSTLVLNPLQKTMDTTKTNLLYGKPDKTTFDNEQDDMLENRMFENRMLQDVHGEINTLKIINKQLYNVFIKMAKHYNDVK